MAGVGKDRNGLGIFQDVGHLAGAQLGIKRHDRHACSRVREIGFNPFRSVFQNQSNRYATRLEMKTAEGLGHLADAFSQLGIRAALPGLVAPITERDCMRVTCRRIIK